MRGADLLKCPVGVQECGFRDALIVRCQSRARRCPQKGENGDIALPRNHSRYCVHPAGKRWRRPKRAKYKSGPAGQGTTAAGPTLRLLPQPALLY